MGEGVDGRSRLRTPAGAGAHRWNVSVLWSRDLVRALDLPMHNAEAYYLAWPEDRADHPPLVAFRDWITAEIAADINS